MKKFYGYLSLLFLVFCLCGCGQAAVSEETEQKIDQIDWRSKGFAEAQKETEQQELWAEKYFPMQREGLVPEVEAEAENHEVKEEGGCAGKWLRRHTYYIGEELERRKQYAEVYDVESDQREMIELTMENIGLEADSGDVETVGFAYIDDMDMTADGRYAILLTRRAVDAEKGFYFSKIQIVTSALDGTPAEVTDVREQFLEKGIFKDEEALTLADTECDYDASGNIYVRSGNSENPNRELYIFDREGKLLAEQRFGEQEYVDPPARTEDGELIFAVRDLQAGRTRMMWFDPEAQRLKTLAEVEEQNWKQVYGLWGNEFYYAAPDGIVRWNIESGERVKVFDFGENGVSTLFQTMFTILDSGEAGFRICQRSRLRDALHGHPRQHGRDHHIHRPRGEDSHHGKPLPRIRRRGTAGDCQWPGCLHSFHVKPDHHLRLRRAPPEGLRDEPQDGDIHRHVRRTRAGLLGDRRGGEHDFIRLRQRGTACMEAERPEQVRQIRLQPARSANPRLGRHGISRGIRLRPVRSEGGDDHLPRRRLLGRGALAESRPAGRHDDMELRRGDGTCRLQGLCRRIRPVLHLHDQWETCVKDLGAEGRAGQRFGNDIYLQLLRGVDGHRLLRFHARHHLFLQPFRDAVAGDGRGWNANLCIQRHAGRGLRDHHGAVQQDFDANLHVHGLQGEEAEPFH